MTAEHERLEEARTQQAPWKKWGPYLSERQWGTVREDYSDGGDAWNYFSHDQARSRAYRWGEDGIAGISDDHQRLCFALALWNGKDPILKERLFGLTNSEGNHGEDVKEYYFYLDSTPTHSYMKYLYKYPQVEFPYSPLVETNRRRGKCDQEYELLDTGVFDDDRYFDVFVEYAKESADDILIEICVQNRGPEAAELQVLPTLWFRNQWSWRASTDRPSLREISTGDGPRVVEATDPHLG
ncbi:MAG TPA: glucosidase, partial [Planctomycetaceae bacterium]|nr:glucosidase [Planctomycetaceae bacterium]